MNISVLCNYLSHFSDAVSIDGVDEVIIEADIRKREERTAHKSAIYPELIAEAHAAGKRIGIALPYIMRDRYLSMMDMRFFDFVLVRNQGELEYMRENFPELRIHSDYNLYAMNSVAAYMLKDLGISRITAPIELNENELRHLGLADKELIIYGHMPMMISAQCIHKNLSGCDQTPGILYLKDRTNRDMPVENKCTYCYNIIDNASPLSLAGIMEKVRRLNPESVRLNMTVETETKEIISKFVSAVKDGIEVGDFVSDFTRGHFTRGVE